MDGTYQMNHIKKGSAHTPQGIVDTFHGYKTALKNTLLNKFVIETPDNKIQEVMLQDGLKELNYNPSTIVDRHEKKDDTKGFILKPVHARPEYGTVYQHQGMLLQNLHCRYIVIQLPHVNDLHQKIPSFPHCEDYGICRASNPNPLQDDT